MRLVYLFSFLFSYCLCLSAQDIADIDSLKKRLRNSKSDFEKYEAYNSILKVYLTTSLDSAKVYNNQLLELAENTPIDTIATKALNLASSYYYYSSNLDSSLFYVEKALRSLENYDNKKLKSDLYRKMAILSSANSNFEDYEKYARLALTVAKETNDLDLISRCLLVVGNIAYHKNDYPKALKRYLQIDSIHSRNDLKTSTLSIALENISIIYMALRSDRALQYFDKAEKLHLHFNNQAGLNNINRLRGNFQAKLKNYDKAIFYLEKTIPFYEKLNDPNKLVEIYTELIRCYSYLGKLEKAEPLVTKTAKLVDKKSFSTFGLNQFQFSAAIYYLEKENYPLAITYFELAEQSAPDKGTDYYLGERTEISKGLTEAYAQLGNYEKAFESSERLLELKDSLAEQNKVALSIELETKYQTEKKEKEIALLEAKNKTIELQKVNQRYLFIAGIGVFSLTAVLLYLALWNRQKTNKRLKELDKAKSRFFENISHEFRTPLSLISAPIEEQLIKQNLTSQERRKLSIAKNNSLRLLALVNQILDLSKLKSNHYRLKVQESNLLQFLKAVIGSFKYQAELKNQEVSCDLEMNQTNYWFDRDVLEKIISNLLENAIKYTPEKNRISIVAKEQNSSLYLKITNTGITLTKDEISHIFSRFYRAHEGVAGTGIGLALTKELVQLHKGSITAESDRDTTQITAILPIRENAFKIDEKNLDAKQKTDIQNIRDFPLIIESEKDESSDLTEDLADRPILLIVDDNADLREYLSALFCDKFLIKTANDGKEGFERALKYIPDIIITDLMMPREDGIEFTEKCKTHSSTSHIPILMLTAKAGDENELKGLEVGADAYTTKPFNTEILKATVRNLLKSRQELQKRFSQEVILTPKEISVNSYDEQFLNNLQDIMDTNLVECDFNAENFASALNMSRMQLHRKLKALTGLSTTEFIRSQRLKLAAQLLRKSEINISQAGYAVGFNNPSYFTKCFKEQFGVSPSDFIKN